MQPQLSPNPLRDVEALFRYPFMVNALAAGTIVAVLAALVGWLMVLRRESFAGHTLSLMSFPGAAFAALVGLPLALGYYLFCVAGALAIAAGAGRGVARDRVRQSAATGVVQAGALALGFVFLSLYGGVLEQLETLLFGSFVGIDAGQVRTLLIVAAVVLALLALGARPLLWASLDGLLARAQGLPVGLLSAGFLALLGLAVAATAQITGALLVFALLVAPAASAQLLTPRIGAGLSLSVAFALVVVWLGLGVAYYTNWPSGFTITSLALLLYLGARALTGARRSAAPVGTAGADA